MPNHLKNILRKERACFMEYITVLCDTFSGRLSFRKKKRLVLISPHIVSSIMFTGRCNRSRSTSNLCLLGMYNNALLPHSQHAHGSWKNGGWLPAQPQPLGYITNEFLLCFLFKPVCHLLSSKLPSWLSFTKPPVI